MINQTKTMSLAGVSAGGSGLPNRCILHGVEGVGKTSFGACAPRPIVVMTRGETGLLTLIDSGQVPETPHFPEAASWEDLLAIVEVLTYESHEYRTLVIDALNGSERLCHECVCRRDFEGRWGRDGFTSFMAGYEVALADWRAFLDALDMLRARRRMSILMLAHSKIGTYRNPEGSDYDRYTVDLHAKTWSVTHKWADIVLFANFVAHVDAKKSDAKGKARGGSRRLIYTTRTASHDAKNRHGLPEVIDAGSSAAEAWANFVAALQAAKPQQPQPADVRQVDISPTNIE
jgi:hypothetical protein